MQCLAAGCEEHERVAHAEQSQRKKGKQRTTRSPYNEHPLSGTIRNTHTHKPCAKASAVATGCGERKKCPAKKNVQHKQFTAAQSKPILENHIEQDADTSINEQCRKTSEGSE